MNPVTFQLLTHASRRAAQRGISIEMISTALNMGEVFFRQGLRYFVCLEKDLIGMLSPKLVERYRNTVVIVNSRNEIVTCYKNKNAMANIKRKGKLLYGNKY